MKFKTMNELVNIFEPLIPHRDNTYWTQKRYKPKVLRLFSLAFNTIEKYNIPKHQLPPSLRDLLYVKAVTIYKNTICYYASFELDIGQYTPLIRNVIGTNYIGCGPYRGIIPDGVECVSIRYGYVPVLPKSVKYLSMYNTSYTTSINIPLLYLRLEKIDKSVYVLWPIKVLVVVDTQKNIYYSFLGYVDYLLHQSAYYSSFINSLTGVCFDFHERHAPQKFVVCDCHIAPSPGHINIDDLMLHFPERTRHILETAVNPTQINLGTYLSERLQKLLNDE